MKIERNDITGTGGYFIEVAGIKKLIAADIVHAVIRHGMQAQRERDAEIMASYAGRNHMDRNRARRLRETAITPADVQAALEGK